MSEKLDELKQRLNIVSDLHNAEAVLSWDQQTYMPPKGATPRKPRALRLMPKERLQISLARGFDFRPPSAS